VRKQLLDPRGLALGRTAVGVSMLARPALIPTQLGVPVEAAEQMTWAMRMLGAREVALGLGAITARKERRLWLAAGVLSDAVDALAVGAALKQGRVKKATGGGLTGVAVSATVIGLNALRRG
jgi:hypothetical protein